MLSTPVDDYCERLGAGLLAEPVNALTNLSFIVAAWFLWRLARDRGVLDARSWSLIVMTGAVGIGSGIFHTYATVLTEWLDIIPILVFQLTFLWLYFRDCVGLGRAVSVGLMVLFVVAALVGESFPEILNGSLLYAPTVLTLLILGIYHYRKPLRNRGILLAATGVFLASLTFRTMDAGICESFPLGTHFMWHLLNGLLLYLAARSYVVNMRPVSGP